MDARAGYTGGRCQEMRRLKSWYVPSERKTEDEVEMMAAEVWKKRKQREQGEHHSQQWWCLWRNTPSQRVWCCLCSAVSVQPLVRLAVVSGISLPRTLPRQLLLCGRCIKREILIHLISGKLASCHPKVSAFSGEFVLLGGV